MSDKGPTSDLDGMGMGLFRWLLWPLRSDKSAEEDEPPRRKRKTKGTKTTHHPGVYRIEVDSEAGRFHGDGPPFSFWSSSRIILILSFLLWWIQPAGPMIAGYVGGRRAGSPMKAVTAALLPVFTIFVANAAYAHNFATHQIDFVASLPTVVSDAASSILPFLVPYKEFMIAYMTGFVNALTTTFGMGTNGYLMVIIFSYIGGLIAEQTRRELTYRSGAGSSLGVNLVQPLLGARPYVEDEEAYEDDEEITRLRRPVRARARGHAAPVVVATRRKHRHRGPVDRYEEYRKLPAEADDVPLLRHAARSHRRDEDESDGEADEDGVVEVRLHHVGHTHAEERREHHRSHVRAENEDDEDDEEHERPSARESRTVHVRTQAEERAIQRFVERALKNYDHSKL